MTQYQKGILEFLNTPYTWIDVAMTSVYGIIIVALIVGWRLTRKNK